MKAKWLYFTLSLSFGPSQHFKPACVHADKNDWNICSVAGWELVMGIDPHADQLIFGNRTS